MAEKTKPTCKMLKIIFSKSTEKTNKLGFLIVFSSKLHNFNEFTNILLSETIGGFKGGVAVHYPP